MHRIGWMSKRGSLLSVLRREPRLYKSFGVSESPRSGVSEGESGTRKEATRKFRWRCVWGTHPFPSRTRWLRPRRPMVLCWRRHGRAGGCRNTIKINALPAMKGQNKRFWLLMTGKTVKKQICDCTLKTAYRRRKDIKYPKII